MKRAFWVSFGQFFSNINANFNSKLRAARMILSTGHTAASIDKFELERIRQYMDGLEAEGIKTQFESRYLSESIAKWAATRQNDNIIEENLTNCMLFLSPDAGVRQRHLDLFETLFLGKTENPLLIRYAAKRYGIPNYEETISGLKELVIERIGAHFGLQNAKELQTILATILTARYDADYLRFLMLEMIELRDFQGLPATQIIKNLPGDVYDICDEIESCDNPTQMLLNWANKESSTHFLADSLQLFELIGLINWTQAKDANQPKLAELRPYNYDGIEVA